MTIAELKAMAEAATPGTWNMKRAERDLMLAWHVEGEKEELIGAQYKSDAAFIAAANPRVVAAMVKMIAALQDLYNSAPEPERPTRRYERAFDTYSSARAALNAALKGTDDV